MTDQIISKNSYPRGVAFVAFTQLWESFSFFGLRALLVLYLISQVGYSNRDAFILYTVYIAFVKIFAAAGGYIVDRFLAYKQAVLIGGILIALGHLLLTFSSSGNLFFLSLGCIICGSAIFRVSLQALLGLLYEKQDCRREQGFTLFYVAMNVGGLLAAVLCGLVANSYGWHAGFGLAAFGMLFGMAFFLSKIKIFKVIEKTKTSSSFFVLVCSLVASVAVGMLLSYFALVQFCALPLSVVALAFILFKMRKKIGKTLLLSVCGSLLLLVAYSTAEELWGSLLMVFSETQIERVIFGVEIPSAAIAAINPLTIIILGPFIAKRQIKFAIKLAAAFFVLTVAFCILSVASMMAHASIFYLMIGLACIALGELFLTPTVLAFASQSAPKQSSAMMMGATTVALSMGSLLSGEVATLKFNPAVTFLLIGASAFALFILLLFLSPNPYKSKIEG